MGVNPSVHTGSALLPVENVTKPQVFEFCNRLSVLDGLEPVFTMTGTDGTIYGTDPAAWKASGLDPLRECIYSSSATANGYRLPEGDEWMVAAWDGGKDIKNYPGTSDRELAVWSDENSEGTTHEVAQKTATLAGIYDLSGNVAELQGNEYTKSDAYEFVLQGGSFKDNPLYYCKVLSGGGAYPNLGDTGTGAYDFAGFRVAR